MSKLIIVTFIGDVEREKCRRRRAFLSRGVKKGVIPRPNKLGLRKRWMKLAPPLALFIFGLSLAGCVNNTQEGSAVDDLKNNKFKQDVSAVTLENYQQFINSILQPYWASNTIEGIKDEILEIVAPAEFLSLHLNIVIAFELIEQGQKDSDQAKIEDGIDRLNNLANHNDWLR